LGLYLIYAKSEKGIKDISLCLINDLSMTNYIIEGKINFFEELNKSTEEDLTDNNAMNTTYCLISNQPFVDNYVTMICGHKFNYLPLYKYLVNYKLKFNGMEKICDRLNNDEIRCPYCRHKQKVLLPFYDMPGVEKKRGINAEFNMNIYNKDFQKENMCFYKKMYITNSVVDGKTVHYEKEYQCSCYLTTTQLPEKYKEKDNNIYCVTHIKTIIKKYDNEEKAIIKKQLLLEKEKTKTLKLEKKLATQKLKEESQKLKEESQKLKEESQKIKEKSKKIKITQAPNQIPFISTDENVIIGNNPLLCQNILKTGINKGKQCSLKKCQGEFCKRHGDKNQVVNILNNNDIMI